MRGKDEQPVLPDLHAGITPAYAGKSIMASTAYDQKRGSPPRMRGKDLTVEASTEHSGITPAYAGKSTRGTDARKPHRDHPRVCGEKL